MTEVCAEFCPGARVPCAFFMGDFNAGKSALINALLRKELLPAGREESRSLPTLIVRHEGGWADYAALSSEAGIVTCSHEEFLGVRQGEGNPKGHLALAARVPGYPFNHLVLADTAGTSSDVLESVRLSGLEDADLGLMVVVTDIEYWSAKHSMDFIAYHHELLHGEVLVVANKADHLNASEIRRISDRAAMRLESYGIRPAPRFFTVSARLEAARGAEHNEYRNRTKREVRERCDAGFDALRVALYEFEAKHGAAAFCPAFESLFDAPLMTSFIKTQQGAAA